MTTRYNGGPAFPLTNEHSPSDGQGIYAHPGMTLRDYFAGQAMTSVIGANPEFSAKAVSEWAYIHADAMLAERAK